MWNWRSLDCIRSRRRPDSSSFSQIAQASHLFLLSPQLHKYHQMHRAFYPRSYTSFPELTAAFLLSLQSGRVALDLKTKAGWVSHSWQRRAGRSALPSSCSLDQPRQKTVLLCGLGRPRFCFLDLFVEELVERSNQLLWWTLLDDFPHFSSKTY